MIINVWMGHGPQCIVLLALSGAGAGLPGLVWGSETPDLCVVPLEIPELSANLVEPDARRLPERLGTEGTPFPLLTSDVEVEGGRSTTAVWTIGPDGTVREPASHFSLRVWDMVPASIGHDN